MSLIDIAILAVAGGLLILAGYAIYSILRTISPRNPTVQAILLALQPYALKAIFTGEYLALTALTQLNSTLEATDKKALADKWYDILPQTIFVGAIPLPIGAVKVLVTREMFEALVDDAFKQTEAEILLAEGVFKVTVPVLAVPKELKDAPTLPS